MAKYDMTKTKKLKFARFGGLSSVNQKGYRAEARSFHSPPATRGFYCFVWPYYELFLLSGGWTKDPWTKGAKFTYVRDKEGNVINNKHPDWEKLAESERYWSSNTKEWSEHQKKWPEFEDPDYDAKVSALDKDWKDNHADTPQWVLVEKPSPKIFDFDGELWHHLGDTLRPGAVLGRHGSWTKSTVSDYRDALEKEKHLMTKGFMKLAYKDLKQVPTKRWAVRCSMKDHLEVFIEKV